MSFSSCLSVLEIVSVSFSSITEMSECCVLLLITLYMRYSQVESLDEIYVMCYSWLSVLELVSVSFFKNRIDAVVHFRVFNYVYYNFIHVVFISWEFRWNFCGFFLLLVCIGTCISKFFKHSRDMVVHVIYVVVHGFHIRLMFVVRGFDISINIVKVILF